ncbi:D-galactarate dehydratase [Rhodobacteraceae bacterium WD3A24]|nr:D-galactarate dehydratase [Rhodobacteraceae bacterium WD3A24]
MQAPEADTPRPAPRAAETGSEPPEPGAELGRTIATLGSPSEPGLWLRTPLVDAARPGVIRLEDGTASAEVELRPSGGTPGSGSALSMAAFRLLGIPLTDLPELVVIAR